MKSSEAMILAVINAMFLQLRKEAWKIQAPVVQTMDSVIRRINHYPVDR